MITVHINGKATSVAKNTKVLHACAKAGYPVPHLCYHEDLPAFGNCGVCMVEINGRALRACSTPCEEGMQIKTTGKKLLDLSEQSIVNDRRVLAIIDFLPMFEFADVNRV